MADKPEKISKALKITDPNDKTTNINEKLSNPLSRNINSNAAIYTPSKLTPGIVSNTQEMRTLNKSTPNFQTGNMVFPKNVLHKTGSWRSNNSVNVMTSNDVSVESDGGFKPKYINTRQYSSDANLDMAGKNNKLRLYRNNSQQDYNRNYINYEDGQYMPDYRVRQIDRGNVGYSDGRVFSSPMKMSATQQFKNNNPLFRGHMVPQMQKGRVPMGSPQIITQNVYTNRVPIHDNRHMNQYSSLVSLNQEPVVPQMAGNFYFDSNNVQTIGRPAKFIRNSFSSLNNYGNVGVINKSNLNNGMYYVSDAQLNSRNGFTFRKVQSKSNSNLSASSNTKPFSQLILMNLPEQLQDLQTLAELFKNYDKVSSIQLMESKDFNKVPISWKRYLGLQLTLTGCGAIVEFETARAAKFCCGVLRKRVKEQKFRVAVIKPGAESELETQYKTLKEDDDTEKGENSDNKFVIDSNASTAEKLITDAKTAHIFPDKTGSASNLVKSAGSTHGSNRSLLSTSDSDTQVDVDKNSKGDDCQEDLPVDDEKSGEGDGNSTTTPVCNKCSHSLPQDDDNKSKPPIVDSKQKYYQFNTQRTNKVNRNKYYKKHQQLLMANPGNYQTMANLSNFEYISDGNNNYYMAPDIGGKNHPMEEYYYTNDGQYSTIDHTRVSENGTFINNGKDKINRISRGQNLYKYTNV